MGDQKPVNAVTQRLMTLLLSIFFWGCVCVWSDRNVPDTSTTGSAALEKRKSDLLDFYLKVDELTPGSESATILLTPIHHFHLYL